MHVELHVLAECKAALFCTTHCDATHIVTTLIALVPCVVNYLHGIGHMLYTKVTSCVKHTNAEGSILI